MKDSQGLQKDRMELYKNDETYIKVLDQLQLIDPQTLTFKVECYKAIDMS